MAVKRFILDANAAADIVYRRRGVELRFREVRRAGHRVGIGLPVIGELLAGVVEQ